MARPKASLIVFDWDGTVSDSVPLVVAAWEHALRAAGLQTLPPASTIRGTVGLSFHEAARLLAPNCQPDTISSAYMSYWKQREKDIALCPDAASVIRSLQNRVKLAIATGMGRRGLDTALQVHGLANCFTFTCAGDEVRRGKPAPDMLELVMQRVGVTPQQTIMVGDSPKDIEMARAAGVLAIGVDFGIGTDTELMAAGAYGVVGDWLELQRMLEFLS